MRIFNLFGSKDKNENDPYWEFDEKEHFRPQLNKGEFFKLNNFEFGWFVLEPLSKFVKNREHEINLGRSLSFGQKALYYWWYLDAQVTNGGFVQFYYNGYAPYVQTIIKGLEHVGDNKMADLVKKADKIYQKNKKLINKAQEEDLFGSDLYDRLNKLSLLDDKYYEMNNTTMSIIENYIRKNPNEICLDEEGNEFDLSFSGLCKSYYENKSIKEEFNLEQGIISGEFMSFYQNGNLKEKIQFSEGEQTGERDEYYENGKPKYSVSNQLEKRTRILKWFFENGNPKKLETKLLSKNEKFGEYKEWHENGQLSISGRYISAYTRDGEWLEFYQDGTRKVEGKGENGEYKLINHWDKNGNQTLTNGTGLYVYENSSFEDETSRIEQEYKNFKRHGKQKTFRNNILTLYQEMENGKSHGITRSYYNNETLKEETIYENGTTISTQKFPKFKNPKVKTTVISRLCENCYEQYEEYQLPENSPMPINHKELAENFVVEPSIFEGYDVDNSLSYGYYLFVSEKGIVMDIKFAVARNMFLDIEVRESMAKLKFEPTTKNGKAINGIHFVRYSLELIDSNK